MTRGRVLLLLLLVLAAVVTWQLGWLVDASPQPAPTPAPPPPFQAAWAAEQDWLVDRITRDVREMGAYAATGALPPANAPAQPPAIGFELHVFSPRLYEPITHETLGWPAALFAATPDDDQEDARLLSALLDPQDLVLVAEDLALSSRLEVTPSDPGAHERAALLLAAFALSDCAGDSTDTRPALTRLTAHIALARALRGGAEPGLARVYAETALVTLLGRESDASARLDALAATAARVEAAAAQCRAAGAGELVAEELRLAQEHLGEITGATTSDELLGRIFGAFCIGK